MGGDRGCRREGKGAGRDRRVLKGGGGGCREEGGREQGGEREGAEGNERVRERSFPFQSLAPGYLSAETRQTGQRDKKKMPGLRLYMDSFSKAAEAKKKGN